MAARYGILPYIGGIFCTLQNTAIAEKNDFENIYDIVNSGRWTADKMYDMTKGVYVDLNGNTEADKEDIYGIELSNYNNSIPFMASCEANVFTKTDSGYEYTFGSERCVDTYNEAPRKYATCDLWRARGFFFENNLESVFHFAGYCQRPTSSVWLIIMSCHSLFRVTNLAFQTVSSPYLWFRDSYANQRVSSESRTGLSPIEDMK